MIFVKDKDRWSRGKGRILFCHNHRPTGHLFKGGIVEFPFSTVTSVLDWIGSGPPAPTRSLPSPTDRLLHYIYSKSHFLPNWRSGSIALLGTTVHCMFLFRLERNFLETPSDTHKDDSPVGPLAYCWHLQPCDWTVYPSDDDSYGDQRSGYCLYGNR